MITIIAAIVEIFLYLILIGFAVAGIVVAVCIALLVSIIRSAAINFED